MGLAARKVLEQAGAASWSRSSLPEEVKPGTRASVFQLEDYEGGKLAAQRLLDIGLFTLIFLREKFDTCWTRAYGGCNDSSRGT